MISQTAGMNWRRYESMSQRVHRQQWCGTGHITMIVAERGTCHGWTRSRLDRNDFDVGAVDLVGDKRECKSGKIATAAGTADNYVNLIFTKHFQLFLSFQPDNGLMEQDVIQDTTERITC